MLGERLAARSTSATKKTRWWIWLSVWYYVTATREAGFLSSIWDCGLQEVAASISQSLSAALRRVYIRSGFFTRPNVKIHEPNCYSSRSRLSWYPSLSSSSPLRPNLGNTAMAGSYGEGSCLSGTQDSTGVQTQCMVWPIGWFLTAQGSRQQKKHQSLGIGRYNSWSVRRCSVAW